MIKETITTTKVKAILKDEKKLFFDLLKKECGKIIIDKEITCNNFQGEGCNIEFNNHTLVSHFCYPTADKETIAFLSLAIYDTTFKRISLAQFNIGLFLGIKSFENHKLQYSEYELRVNKFEKPVWLNIDDSQNELSSKALINTWVNNLIHLANLNDSILKVPNEKFAIERLLKAVH